MAEQLRDLPEPPSTGIAAPWISLDKTPDRGVVTAVFRNELRRWAGGFRFRASAFLIVALMAITGAAAGAGYRGEVLEQTAVAKAYETRLAGSTIDGIVELLHPAIRPPWRLALGVEGGQSSTPDLYEQALSVQVSPELRRIRNANPRLPGREPLDWMFMVRVVLSLAAFLLGYDAICGDRRQGTLKLALSYPISRWKVPAGKFLALWTCLAAPFLVGAALSLALASVEGMPLGAEDLAKAGLVALTGLWAAAFYVLAALLISSLARDSSVSLSVLVWLWVTAVVVTPAVSGLLARRLHPIPTDSEVAREIAEIQRRTAREHAGREGRWRQPAWAAADGFAWEKASAEAENRRFALREEVRHRVLRSKLAQARLARDLSSISPGSLATGIAESLAGSGLGRDQSFLEQAQAFHRILTDRVRALDARDPESPHILFFKGWVSTRPVRPDAIPRFSFRERPLLAGLAAAGPAMALFAFETLALAAAALFFFSRYDAG